MPKTLWHMRLSLQVTGVYMWQHDPLLQVQALSAATNQCLGGHASQRTDRGVLCAAVYICCVTLLWLPACMVLLCHVS